MRWLSILVGKHDPSPVVMGACRHGGCWHVFCRKEKVGGFLMANTDGNAMDNIRRSDKDIWVHTGFPRIHSGLLKERQTLERFKKQGSSVTTIVFLGSIFLLGIYIILGLFGQGVDSE